MIRFFLERRILTNLLTLLMVGWGLWIFVNMRREAFPEVTFDIVTVRTLYPGASPEEVERLVTTPIENTLKTVNNIDRVESYSIENISMVVLRLTENLSSQQISRAVSDIQQAVSSVEELPEEAKAPIVEELTSNRPVLIVSVAGGNDESRDYFAEKFKDRLEDIPGVSRVDTDGDRAREIWVEADPLKLRENRLSLGEIANVLKAENIKLSAGSIETGTQDLRLRTVGRFETAQDIAAVILRGNDERNFLRVQDVARVRETFSEEKVLARAQGLPAINLQVRKKKEGDTINVAKQIKELLKEEEARAQELRIKLFISDDFSFFIQRRLNVMKNNMIQGGFLIILALFLFLDWRLALVAALGVPISFGLAMIGGAPFGLTINLLSLLGFIIVLGMLDDDSVVAAENIYRHLEMGKPPKQAAIEGVKEIMLPVLGSVGATTAAFIPFALMKGIMGKFLFMIPVIVILCFVASVFEAFFILPAHVLDLLPYGKPVEEKKDGRWYAVVIAAYRRALGWCMDHRYRFLALAAAFLLVTLGMASWRLKLVMFPPGLIDQFFVQIEMPEGTALSHSQKAVEEAERLVMALPPTQLEGITATVGLTGYEENVRRGTHYGQVRVFLVPQENRERETDDILAELKPKLLAIAGTHKVTIEKLRPGPPVGRAVQVRVRGDDPQTLGLISERIKNELRDMPGVSDIKDNFEEGKEELVITPKAREAAYAGVPASQIARHIFYAFDGGEITKIRRPHEEVVVKVRLAPSYRKNPESLRQLLVTNNQGKQVDLAPLVSQERRPSPAYIEHYNYKRAIEISADVDNQRITSYQANAAIQKSFKNFANEYPGYDAIYGGEEERTQESIQSLKRGFVIAIFLDVIILATLFNSYVQPFIILLTIPIGLTGVAWALILHGQPASFMALLGAVAMTGVVVNNAIVLVDFINQERRKGIPLRDAVIDAGAVRLRPIFASSITTLLGLFPTAYGIGGYEPFVAPICLTLAWGLTLAMPLTLFAIPMATVIMDDVKSKISRRKQ